MEAHWIGKIGKVDSLAEGAGLPEAKPAGDGGMTMAEIESIQCPKSRV